MKDTLVSKCEKAFLLKAIDENLRLDTRQLDEYRNVTIHFGIDWGSCLVTLGETRVLAQVSCDIQQPKASKPNEGLLYVNVEMSPMAALHFELGRQSDISVQVNRLLEKCLKESKCVDLEALCIVAEEKVWNLRIDLNVMNYEGNLAGCCSVAALAALAHFRHPDVTSTGEKIIIHSNSEKDPIPINLHHYPVVISYAVFNSGKQILSDPTTLEEKVADSLLLLSINSYREFCGMHFEGVPLPSSDVVIKCSKNAADHAICLVKQIKTALQDDSERRLNKIPFSGLLESLNLDHIFSRIQKNLRIPFAKEESPDIKMEIDESKESDVYTDEANEEMEIKSGRENEATKYFIKQKGNKIAELTTDNKMYTDDSNSSDDIQIIKEENKFKKIEEIQSSGDSSEEEEVVVLHSIRDT